MPMFNIRKEGEAVHPGFNFSPMKSNGNAGNHWCLILRVGDLFIMFRYRQKMPWIFRYGVYPTPEAAA